MKKTTYKIKKDAGRFRVIMRRPGHNYFESAGVAFFTEADAKAWIKAQ